MSADCKIATRPFHFCLDKAAVLRFRSRSNCALNMAQRSIESGVCVFSSMPTRSPVSSSASKEETVETAEKTFTTTGY